MFDMNEVGKRITQLRKDRNMTQMELADKLGISYQAVSNWERGSSMPDISKLPELAELFNISIDFILGSNNEKYAKIVNTVIEEEKSGHSSAIPFESDEINEVIPLLKPEQAKKLYENVPDIKSLKDILIAAQYVEPDLIDQMVLKHLENDPVVSERIFLSIAKYTGAEVRNKLALCLVSCTNNFHIYSFAHLIDEKTLKTIVKREMNKNSGYISGKSLRVIAEKTDESFCNELAVYVSENQNLTDLGEIAPFIAREFLDRVVTEHISNDPDVTMRGVKALEPYTSKNVTDKLYLLCENFYESKSFVNFPFNFNNFGRKISDMINNNMKREFYSNENAFYSKYNNACRYLSKYMKDKISDDDNLINEIAEEIAKNGKLSDLNVLQRYADRNVLDKIALRCVDKDAYFDISETSEISGFLSRETIVKIITKTTEQ